MRNTIKSEWAINLPFFLNRNETMKLWNDYFVCPAKSPGRDVCYIVTALHIHELYETLSSK